MKRGAFIFDGVNSEDLNTLIQYRPIVDAPMRKVETKSPYGIDGDIPFDEGSYSNTEMELILVVNGRNVIADRQALYNVMDTRGMYKEFIPFFDPEKIYRVMLMDKVQFENTHMYGNAQAVSVKFTIKPYKYLVKNDPVTISGTSGTITNPTNYVSQPIIKVTGTGNVTLKVNGEDFNIRNLPNHITLNSERYIAYQEDTSGNLINMNDRVGTREYPILKPGVNTISATGSVTKIEIQPRWRSLV